MYVCVCELVFLQYTYRLINQIGNSGSNLMAVLLI